MLKKDLFVLHAGLDAVGKLQGVKFAYAVAKNLQIVSRELLAIQEAMKLSDDYLAFERERFALCKKHAEKDDKGQPIVVGSEYIIENKKSFDKEFASLKDQYEDTCAAREKQLKEYDELLNEPCDLVLHEINKEFLPENITGEQLFGIIEIVENVKAADAP